MSIKTEKVKFDSKRVFGFKTRTTNADEMAGKGRIAKLWRQFETEKLSQKLENISENGAVFGIYHEYETDFNGLYTLTIGHAVAGNDDLSKSDLEECQIVSGSYLKFETQGDSPTGVIALWQEIWGYDFEKQALKRAYQTDFEYYTGPNQCYIYNDVLSI